MVTNPKLQIKILILVGFLVGGIAAKAADFEFSPASGQLPVGCTNTLEIYADATGNQSNSADIIVNFDPTKVQIQDSDTSIAGVQVRQGNAYQAYVANQVNNTSGEIKVTALSFSNFLNNRRLFASIKFSAVGNPSNIQFTIQFTAPGATLDSNIADFSTSLDLLTAVTNGNYTFTAGNCDPDSQPPQVQFVTPPPLATNVGANSNVVVTITDNLSGLDISTLVIVINGNSYSISSPAVSYTGGLTNYTFTIDPTIPLFTDQTNTIAVVGADLAGNNFVAQSSFNVPVGQQPPTNSCNCGPASGGDGSVIVLPPADDILNGTPLDNTIVQDVAKNLVGNLGYAGSGALVTGAALSLTFLPYLSLINAPGLLINMFSYLFGYRSRKPWGVVVDAVTGLPVAFATCRVYLQGTTGFVTQTVSDPDGKYGFVLSSGTYRLEVIQNKYNKFQKDITIEGNRGTYVYDVQLVPKDLEAEAVGRMKQAWTKFKDSASKVWTTLRPLLFLMGFALSVASVVAVASIVNIGVFLFYVVIIVIYIASTATTKPRSASVVDSATGLRVPAAIIKFFNPETLEVVDTQVTNTAGLFDFWGEPADYAMLVTARGYSFPSSKQADLPQVAYGQIKLIKVNLKKGRNTIQVYLDPATGPGGFSGFK